MPTYEYECDGCGHAFEQFQSMKDKRLRKCPKCGKMKLRRLVGAGGAVLFKGSGFYETDYKRAGSKPSEKPEASSEAKSETSDSKSEGAGEKSESSSGKGDASSGEGKGSET